MRRQGKYTKRVTPAQHVKRRAKHHFRWWRKASWKKRILAITLPVFIFLIILPLATYAYFARDIANQDRLMNRNNTGIVLYATDGKTQVYSEGRATHRELYPLKNISKYMKNAVVASEDKDFYEHSGVSFFSTLRAIYGYVANGGGSFGGSTITQQLAKITVLSDNRSVLRQYQAFSIALAIENTYSKDQILEMYLNSVYFGERAFGIEDAARTYFGTTPDKLNLAQSAMLVGLLPAPSIYSPVTGNAEYAKERQNTVLGRMVRNGYIKEVEKKAAYEEQLVYQPPKSPINDSIAPHFAQMVLDELYAKYGEETVTRSGYQVMTTLDVGVQKNLQAAVAANMGTIQRNGGSNAAAVAIDPTSGEVRGLLGSYDWNNEIFGKVNVATSLRQPGSSFKPIYYSRALADGAITPATVLKDELTDFGGGYIPYNADRKFRGDVTVRNALAWSLNIPSVKVMQKIGIDTAIEQAQSMGLKSIDKKNNYGLSLALGSAEVTLLQMTDAYAAFANKGEQFSNTLIRTIDNKYSEEVFKAKPTVKKVISPQGAFLISHILSDNAARAAVFGSSLNVYDAKTGRTKTVAVKTGTTNDSRDAWTIGYTPKMTIGVWVGNNDNTAMRNGGSIMAGPIFTRAMGSIMAGDDTKFDQPLGVTQRQICRSNHGLADKTVSGITYAEWFLATALPTTRCSVSTPSPTPTPTPTPTQNNDEDQQSVTMSLSASPPSGTVQQNTYVTFTANLSDTSIDGMVQFAENGDNFSTVSVINGQASAVKLMSNTGVRMITATFYPEDDSDPVSTSINYQVLSNANWRNRNDADNRGQ